jgi:hypothetical protein
MDGNRVYRTLTSSLRDARPKTKIMPLCAFFFAACLPWRRPQLSRRRRKTFVECMVLQPTLLCAATARPIQKVSFSLRILNSQRSTVRIDKLALWSWSRGRLLLTTRKMVNSSCRRSQSLRFWNKSHLQTKEARNYATGRVEYPVQGPLEFGSRIMQMCTSDMTSGVRKV